MAGERKSQESGIHSRALEGVGEVAENILTAMDSDEGLGGLDTSNSPHGGALGRADDAAKAEGYKGGIEEKKGRKAMASELRSRGFAEDTIDQLVDEEYGPVTASNANPDRPDYEEGDDATDEAVDALRGDEDRPEGDGGEYEDGDEASHEYDGDLERLELPEGADPLVTVRVDGESVEIPLSEALSGYSRTESWTRKSQALGAERRAFEGERVQAMQSVKAMTQQLAFARQVMAEMGVGPQELMVLDQAYHATTSQVAQQMEATQKAELERAREILPEVIPEWSTPEVASAERAGMLQYALDNGFTEAEVAQVRNPRLVKLLRDAWKGKLLQEQQARNMSEVRGKTKKAKTLQPGSRKSQKAQARAKQKARQREVRDHLSRSGRTSDAAAALYASGLLDDMD